MIIENRKTQSNTFFYRNSNYMILKRMIDLTFSLIVLIGIFPLLIIIGLCVLVDSGFPIIFKQTRTGINGKTFIIWKFRTMKKSTSLNKTKNKKEKKGWKNGVPNSFVFKSSSPVEATKLGKLLRKYSLDELPQLINVIQGDMSLIGPRPEIPDITKYYNDNQRERLQVKPGLTGYAQVNGRSNINHGQKIMYDKYYVENISFYLDLKIFIWTIFKLIKPDDSY